MKNKKVLPISTGTVLEYLALRELEVMEVQRILKLWEKKSPEQEDDKIKNP